MAIAKEIFKAYDIRGIYNKDLTDEVAYRLGRAYVALRRKESKKTRFTFMVAGDMRASTPALKQALIRGLTEGGADVVDAGVNSTPTFYFGVAFFGYDGGIMVSASHNSAEWNGFKIVREKSVPVSGDTGIHELYEMVAANAFGAAGVGADGSGGEKIGSVTEKTDVLTTQIQEDLKMVDLKQLKPLKIVADAANAVGALYMEELFKYLPCKLIPMYFELDGNFPNHEADPLKESNLVDLKKRVTAEGADLGIALDGDGDRIFFVDNKGKSIPQSIIRGILSMIFLREKPGAKIAYDIRPGRITRDMIIENGGTPIVTRVGHSLIKEQALKEGAYFAGESSGHFFLNQTIGCFEIPTIVTLKLLAEFSQTKKTVAEYIAPYKKYFQSGEINSQVEDKLATLKKIETTYADAKIDKLDGITIEYDDFWFNVRPSNTESTMRLNLEARSQETCDEKTKEVLAVING
ncbi:MAG: hypothetical protein A3F54_03935 [Candidatus Kerfeldbacteria bacterium RIFCSPHIGHO2_12_FULL_48_17]|uniref:Phosphomannomutase/phosphoglucomutase n=1 Tax=Candidatus Kerfeldbacteria bacterium RIFCSPHIGHO2_12_FULL_48_17 TaxID=1798542 RepID=A0A1G2B547_9BACT|nr:MAG: hypothetical protein A3F54_03935 [Candidatus Kerfeldbacteria bacterium RIFCSPHIGHO2_12_FULL_48_17]